MLFNNINIFLYYIVDQCHKLRRDSRDHCSDKDAADLFCRQRGSVLSHLLFSFSLRMLVTEHKHPLISPGITPI